MDAERTILAQLAGPALAKANPTKQSHAVDGNRFQQLGSRSGHRVQSIPTFLTLPLPNHLAGHIAKD